MENKPYKFVEWDVPKLSELQESIEYKLYINRFNLNKQEKSLLFRELQTNSHSKQGIALHGWMFPFADILKRYLVKAKFYGWLEVYSADKGSIRDYFGKGTIEIKEM